MQKIILSIIVSFLMATTAAQAGQILVDIAGFEHTKGRLMLGLYNQSNDFAKMDKAYRQASLKPIKGTISHTFFNIPRGYYALAIFYDENNNAKLDKNFMGLPKEKYGFSNNPATFFGAPDFNAAQFKLEHNQHLNIQLK
jgi:uncharacterized protein (DUF2141 family)